MSSQKPVKVLFVCMGNICRSPTAHGVFQSIVDANGLASRIKVDSAGTHSYHIDSPPDRRSQATARARGVELAGLRARRFSSVDFIDFDYLIGMDRENLANMIAIKPEETNAEVNLMLEYSKDFDQQEVPDPYFGNEGFDLVYDMIEDASQGLLEEIRERHEF